MDLLLDTHVLVWWDAQNRKLSAAAASAIADPANQIFVSAASAWEIAVKQRAGRLAFPISPSQAITKNGFATLDISIDHAEAAAALPLIHHDPFDRLLIAQAQLRHLVLVTDDAKIKLYDVARLAAR